MIGDIAMKRFVAYTWCITSVFVIFSRLALLCCIYRRFLHCIKTKHFIYFYM